MSRSQADPLYIDTIVKPSKALQPFRLCWVRIWPQNPQNPQNLKIRLKKSLSNFWPFSIVPGVVWPPESESEVRFLIPPSPELLTVKLKTPPGPPPICISNERAHRTEQLCCWSRQLKMYHFVRNLRWRWSQSQNVWKMYKKSYFIEFFKMKPRWNLIMMYSKVVELFELYLFTQDNYQIHW